MIDFLDAKVLIMQAKKGLLESAINASCYLGIMGKEIGLGIEQVHRLA
jgi:hypothetical protein